MPKTGPDHEGGGPPPASRAVILEAAGAEVAAVGARRASVRSVARRVGMTHQSVGYHFPSRAALLTAVAVDGYEHLVRRTETEVAEVPAASPVGSLAIAVGVAYVGFAREQRALFDLMLMSDAVDAADPGLLEQRARMWWLLKTTVAAEVERGWGGGVGAHELAIMAWTVVHGLATLGDLVPGEPDAGELLRTINAAIRQG